MADWLSEHNHEANRDKEIPGMCLTIIVIESSRDISDSMRVEEIRLVTLDDYHLGMLSKYVMHSWPSTKAEVHRELHPYWSFREEIIIIGGIAMKDRKIIVSTSLQGKALNHQHLNHMGIEKMRLLTC